MNNPNCKILNFLLNFITCLLYTFDAADEEDSVDLGGRRINKKKKYISYFLSLIPI